jgi:CheY-like chemotaxis protein
MENHQKTILIVEDSVVQALSLMRLLEERDLNVLWALDGRIGVEMAHQHKPDLIVLDIEMPEMDGFEACKRLRESAVTGKIPIIMLTVRSEPDAVYRGLDLGAVDFIPKDVFSETVLLGTLRQLDLIEDVKSL